MVWGQKITAAGGHAALEPGRLSQGVCRPAQRADRGRRRAVAETVDARREPPPEKHPTRHARTGVGIRSTSAPPKRRRVAVTRRCELLDVARSTVYDRPTGISAEDLALMRLVDEIH